LISEKQLSSRRKYEAWDFGAGALGNLYRVIADAEAMAALRAALAHRVTYFDTAPHYGFGLSEKRLGHFLGEIGGARDIVVSTKVGRVLARRPRRICGTARQGFISPEPYESVFDYSYDGIMRSFEESRRRLGGISTFSTCMTWACDARERPFRADAVVHERGISRDTQFA
jgi:D-threo-aldose 1-dehydrogenase